MTTEKKSKTPKKSNYREITERDYKMFRYLWKWKALSTMAISTKFYPGSHPASAYRRLRRLELAGYLKTSRLNDRQKEVWVLTDRSFKHIFHNLGDLQSKGYKSETLDHDFLATAFHLGEWLTHQPEDSQNYSEQQLRCYPVDAWPSWVPTSSGHRPDGYSYLNNKKLLIAYEVELWIKARDRYESVVAFYDREDKINLVFWLLDSKSKLTSLKESFEKFNVRDWGKHHFVLMSDFTKQGWMAPTIEGRFRGKTLLELTYQLSLSSLSDARQFTNTQALLDSRKYPTKSKTSKQDQTTKTAD